MCFGCDFDTFAAFAVKVDPSGLWTLNASRVLSKEIVHLSWLPVIGGKRGWLPVIGGKRGELVICCNNNSNSFHWME